jgi:hypothetical protein
MYQTTVKLPQTVVAGEFQNGKSTLINCLLDDKYAPTGNGLRTTGCCSYFRYGEAEVARLVSRSGTEKFLDRREDIFDSSFDCFPSDHLEITCWKPLLQHAVLADTPGFGVDSCDDRTAEEAVEHSDIVLFLHASTALSESAVRMLQLFREKGKHLFFLFNCKDESKWDPASPKNQEICQIIEAQLRGMGILDALIPIGGKKVWPCNPLWAWYALGHLQRDLDSPFENVREDAQEKIESIYSFCKKRKLPLQGNKQQLLRMSGLLEIRRSVEQVASTLMGNMISDSAGEIRNLTGNWLARMRKIIETSKV